MTKKIKKVLCFTLAATVLFVQSNVFAATDEEEAEVKITFTAGGSVLPLDPTNPTGPIPPEGTPITVTSASIVQVSNIDFDSQNIPAGLGKFKSKTKNVFVYIADLRGTNSGWTLTAKLAPLKNADESKTLLGATLKLNAGATTQIGSTTSQTIDPEAAITLDSISTPADICAASATKGGGGWITAWLADTDEAVTDNLKVVLEVPGSSVAIDTYKAKLTWILSFVP